MLLYTQIYAYIGAFWLAFGLIYIIAPPGKESRPQLQGSYTKLLNASAMLARYYCT